MTTIQRTFARGVLTGGASLIALAISSGAAAAEQAEFQIAAGDLQKALNQYIDQSGEQLIYRVDEVRGVETKGVAGAHESDDALEILLQGTGYEARWDQSGAAVVVKTGMVREAGGETNGSFRVAQATAQDDRAVATIDGRDDEQDEDDQERDTIIVTGTNIRGIAPESSPTRTFTREDIQISGAGTAQDFIQTLPGNFGGGSNADLPSGLPNDDNSRFNESFGSSVNLRGLGSGSTLVLLNGRRLAPTSGIGDFADISMIPASAIERVELLTDGASSIYGSDAVAGVVNFILRDDFDGIETSFRYGFGTQNHSGEEFRVGLTGGLNWADGNALLSYEYFNQDEIAAQDRSFSQGIQLPNILLPSQERHSVLGTLSHELKTNFEVFADITYSNRLKSERPFRQNLTGPIFIEAASSQNLNLAAGGAWEFADTWVLDVSGTYTKSATQREQVGPSSTVDQDIDSTVWIADVLASGAVLQFPGGEFKLAVGGQFRSEEFANIFLVGSGGDRQASRNVYALYGEGFIPLIGSKNARPGIERLEINVSGRYDHYSDFGSTINPKVGVLWSPVDALKLRGTYSTAFNPPPLGRVGEANFQVGAIDNTAINALFGLTPPDPSIADVISLTAFGTSNDLDAENSRAFTGGLDFDHEWRLSKISLSMSWFDIKFENRLGSTPCSECSLIPFDAPYVAFNNPDAFPEGTIIFTPSADQIDDLVNRADLLFADSPPLFGNPFDAQIINLTSVVRNLSLTLVSGLDFDVTYNYDLKSGELTFQLDGVYLQNFKQQAASTTPAVEQVSTRFNPVDLKLRGRAGYSNDGFAANVFVNYVNDYKISNAADSQRIDSWTTVDFTMSYDTQSRLGNSFLNDTVFRLSVINLFDQDPPSLPEVSSALIVGYDPANSSPLGRFLAFEITKRF